MNRRELFVSFSSPSNGHFWHPKCLGLLGPDTFDSSFVRVSLDHLVGAQKERLPNGQTERLGCGQIDDEIEFGRLLDRKLARLRAAQNLVDIIGGAPKQVRNARSIGHKASRFDVLPQACDRW